MKTLIYFFFILGIILFEIGYDIKYTVPAMDLGFDPFLMVFIIMGRLALYSLVFSIYYTIIEYLYKKYKI
jgi:hypothetical protein